MPIYTGNSKPAGMTDATTGKSVSQYPQDGIATPWGRLEPLLQPDQLKSRFLKGIPLTLKIKDPETGKPFRITDEELKDYIELAVGEAEQETGLTLMPVQVQKKLPFQKQDFENFGYFQLPHRPVSSIESLTVNLADGSDIFVFPTQWIETANLITGQLNILPLAFQGIEGGTGIVGSGIDGGSGTAVFFNALWNRPYVAALFGVIYTAGFKNGLMPKMVNQLIGIIVTMSVLSQIAAAYAGTTSTSLGIDGLSQSVGTPGPNRYAKRMEELQAQRTLLVKKIKAKYATKLIVGTI